MKPNPNKTARDVVNNPETYHAQPAILAQAWAILMEERGHRVALDHIGPPAHRIAAPAPVSLADDLAIRRPRITARIREIAIAKGFTRGPHDGDAA